MQSNRRLNSEKFQNFRFEPKVAIFDEKSQKMKTRGILRFPRIYFTCDFYDFPEDDQSDNCYFCEKF